MAEVGAKGYVWSGFRSVSNVRVCVYVHRARGLRVVAHVDDFLVTGPKAKLLELRRQLQKDYEVDGDVLGLEDDEKPVGTFLGRQISVKSWGLQTEVDNRQVKSSFRRV